MGEATTARSLHRMHPRVRLTLMAVAAIVIAGAAIIILGGLGRTSTDAVGRTGWAGALRPLSIPVTPFSLRDQEGRRTTLADVRGRVTIVTFMYTTCQDTCPIQAAQISGALDELGDRAAPAVIAVSVDPAGDTPDRARRFLLKHRLTGRAQFLLGAPAKLAPLWRAYGIQPQTPEFDHSANVVLLDRRGVQRIGFPLDQLTPEGLAHDVRRLEAEGRTAASAS